MNCEDYSILFDELLEGELDAETARAVDAHLFGCRACEREFIALKREKEIYAHFLFEIEPPADLAQKFRAKLNAAAPEEKTSDAPAARLTISGLFARLTPKPLMIGAFVLLVVVSAYFGLRKPAENAETTFVLPPELETAPPEPTPAPRVPKETRPAGNLPEIIKVASAAPKTSNNPASRPPEPSVRPKNMRNLPEAPKRRPDEARKLEEIRAFETETARQFEKVELLLRAFRNARYTEDAAEYDVAYEKRQARRLLENNVRLRQKAEIYGTPLANEMLGRVEPYLLEIANLASNPSDEEVLEIKQRVKNQNIIAGLQGF